MHKIIQGFLSITRRELAQKMVARCKKFGVEILELEEVASSDLKGGKKIVKTNKATYEAKLVIIASRTVAYATTHCFRIKLERRKS